MIKEYILLLAPQSLWVSSVGSGGADLFIFFGGLYLQRCLEGMSQGPGGCHSDLHPHVVRLTHLPQVCYVRLVITATGTERNDTLSEAPESQNSIFPFSQ